MQRINFRKQLEARMRELTPLALKAMREVEEAKEPTAVQLYASGKMNGILETLQSVLGLYDYCESENTTKLITAVNNVVDAKGLFKP